MRPVSQAKVTLGHRFFTKNLSAAGRRPANDGPKGKTAPAGSAIRPWDAGGLHAAVQLLENRSVFQKPKKAKKKKKKKNKTKIIIMTKKKKPGRPAPEADLRSAGPRAGPQARRTVLERNGPGARQPYLLRVLGLPRSMDSKIQVSEDKHPDQDHTGIIQNFGRNGPGGKTFTKNRYGHTTLPQLSFLCKRISRLPVKQTGAAIIIQKQPT
jgi:hypothetical protein